MIADCGRLGAGGPPYDLLARASAVLLVTRPNPGDVIRLRDRAAAVTAAANARGRRGLTPAVVVIAEQRTLRATAAEVGHALAQGSVPATVLGGIADDDKGAELLLGQWGGKLDKTLLIRTAGRRRSNWRPACAAPARRHRHTRQHRPRPGPPATAQQQYPAPATPHQPARGRPRGGDARGPRPSQAPARRGRRPARAAAAAGRRERRRGHVAARTSASSPGR